MVAYISSVKYNSIISSVVKEKDEIIAHNLINDHVNLYKYIQANVTLFSGYDYFIVDISAVDDVDDDIIKALEMYRTFNELTRIIIVSPNRRAGNELLAKIFSLGINNIAASFDQLELREELTKCMSETGKSFKEAIIFKDVSNALNSELKEIKKIVEKVTIGFASCQNRIGCTHNAILMALALRKKGYIVAIAEMCCKSLAFNKIRNSFNKQLQNNFFSIDGLDFYPDANKHTLVEIKQKAYNFIIIDFGNYSDFETEDYFKCHEKVMVTGSKPWEIEYLSEFLSIYDDETLSSINYIFNFTPEINQKEIKRNLKLHNGEKLKAYFQDYTPDLFNTFTFKELDKILKDYLIEKKQKKGIFGMKKFIFSFVISISVLCAACGGKSSNTSSSNNKPEQSSVEGKNNKNDKDAPVAELLIKNGFLYNEKREINAYDFIDEKSVQDESDVIAGFINVKEGEFIDCKTFVSEYFDKEIEGTEQKIDKKKLNNIKETISANTTDSYAISADLVLADINGNARIYPIIIDIDNEAPVIEAQNIYVEWNIGENIWNFGQGFPENKEAKAYDVETNKEVQITDEDYKNIYNEVFANVGLNYSDNFFGNMAFHTVIATKDGSQVYRAHTYDSVKDVTKIVDKDMLDKDPKAAKLPEIKGLLSSTLKDLSGNSTFVYNISYGTKNLAPEIDQSFNDKLTPDDNTITRHYIQKLKLEDSTNETYVERHITVKFIGN
jgi:hypothetical protein